MPKKDNTHYIFVVIAFILLFMVWRYKNKVLPRNEPLTTNQSNASAPATQAPQIIEPSEVENQNLKSQAAKRKVLAAKERLGMKLMPIPVVGPGQYELPVEVVMRNLWCRGGEYEGIKSAVRNFDKKVLLLAVESSTSSREVAQPLRVNLSELSKGFRHTFKLRMNAKTNENYAISLCTDSKRLNRCSDHKPADYTKINAVTASNPHANVKEDYTFVYHSLFVKDGNLAAIGSLDFSDDYYQKVSDILKSEAYETGSFERTWKAARTIRSTPLDLGAGKLVLYVTRNDPKCDMR